MIIGRFQNIFTHLPFMGTLEMADDLVQPFLEPVYADQDGLEPYRGIVGRSSSEVTRSVMGADVAVLASELKGSHYPLAISLLSNHIIPAWSKLAVLPIAFQDSQERRIVEHLNAREQAKRNRVLKSHPSAFGQVWSPEMGGVGDMSVLALSQARRELAPFGGEIRSSQVVGTSFSLWQNRPVVTVSKEATRDGFCDDAALAHEMDHLRLWQELKNSLEQKGLSPDRAGHEAWLLFLSMRGRFVGESRASLVEFGTRLVEASISDAKTPVWNLMPKDLLKYATYPYLSRLLTAIGNLWELRDMKMARLRPSIRLHRATKRMKALSSQLAYHLWQEVLSLSVLLNLEEDDLLEQLFELSNPNDIYHYPPDFVYAYQLMRKYV